MMVEETVVVMVEETVVMVEVTKGKRTNVILHERHVAAHLLLWYKYEVLAVSIGFAVGKQQEHACGILPRAHSLGPPHICLLLYDIISGLILRNYLHEAALSAFQVLRLATSHLPRSP